MAPELAKVVAPVGLFVILHAFSSGATALTGVEAISDGVPAFRHPRAKNAAETLAIMGAISVTMFLGISFLATHIHGITVSEEGSVVGQIAHAVFRGGLPLLHRAVLHERHPDPRREHGVSGLPAAVVDPGPRPVHATTVRQPRRPARVLQRGDRAGIPGDAC